LQGGISALAIDAGTAPFRPQVGFRGIGKKDMGPQENGKEGKGRNPKKERALFHPFILQSAH
jgi:hypothetical protein